PAGARRRSAQTVLHRLALDIARLVAPILPMTADEVWETIPGRGEASVHLALFPAVDGSVEEGAGWPAMLETRTVVMKALEKVGKLSAHPGVCERCAAVLEGLAR